MLVLLLLLFGGFLGLWAYKAQTPVNRPDEYADGYDESAGKWWESGTTEVDDDWKLDPEIPLNYIPVPGEHELYMVVDNDGNIIGYRQRTKQIDGSWKWEDVNPDIPEGYEKVDGLEDVYKVTNEDGSVSYFKYVRNDDDTFAFVEVDEAGNPIGKDRDATTIDGRHVHISGNIYSYLDENGVVIGYDKRIDNGDGTFSWETTDNPLPTLPDMSDIQNSLTQGMDTESSLSGGGDLDDSFLDSMRQQMQQANNEANQGSQDNYNIDINYNNSGTAETNSSGIADVTPSTPTIINNTDGTHTEIETIRETKNVDGYTSVYETTVYRKYDVSGNLLETKSEGPYEVSTTQDITKETDPVQGSSSEKESTLGGEIARVAGSYTYKDSIASDVFAAVNAQRKSKGLNTLTMSDTATQIAKLRAADMAGYDVSTSDLPTYGTLGTMLSDYRISSQQPGENLWKTTPRTADEIHTRFQAVESARNTRMAEYATEYGCAIVEKNGYYYIAEVII